jgi:twitching motility two-component system response regulator PilG
MSDQSRPLVIAIDDSPIIRTIIEYTLARVGVRVVTFADGMSAMRALQGQSASAPDLVLVDVDLPRMSGYEVADLLHSAYHDVPIVMLSGHDGLLDKMRGRLAGAHDFIGKPFKPSELATLVCRRLGIDGPGTARDASDGAR